MAKRAEGENARIAREIIVAYQPETVSEMQEALKGIFGPMFEAMLQGELSAHLGYERNERGEKLTANRRNGYSRKTLKTTAGDVEVEVPRDREGSFEPQLVAKRQRDVSAIEDKVLSMYAKGLSQRDISATVEDIYGFEMSHEAISSITDSVHEQLERHGRKFCVREIRQRSRNGTEISGQISGMIPSLVQAWTDGVVCAPLAA